MAEHDYLSAALNHNGAGFTVQQLADAPTLMTVYAALQTHGDNMRLGALAPAEREQLGDPSSADEVRINQIYVNMTLRFPQLMTKLGVAPTLMADAHRSEHALAQAEGVFHKLRVGARVGCVVALADLTAQLDKVEGAVVRRFDPASLDVTPQEKATLEARFFPLQEQREALFQRSAGRKQRATTRAQQLATALNSSDQSQQAILQEQALRDAALPAPADPTATPIKKTGKTQKALPSANSPAPKKKTRKPVAKKPGTQTTTTKAKKPGSKTKG